MFGFGYFANFGPMLKNTFHLAPVLAGLLISFSPASLPAKVIEQVIVAINGDPYTLSDLKGFAKTKLNREFPRGDLNAIEKEDQEVLEQFITEKLLEAEVKRLGIKIGEEDIDNYISQIKQKNQLSDEDLRAVLAREGVTIEKYRASVRGEIEKGEIINRQVRKRVNITDEDVERYYRSNAKRYMTRERVRLRHILLPVPEGASAGREKEILEKAAEIRARATTGEDFAKLAGEYSDGAGASDGGDIGWVFPGSLLKEIEEVAFNKLALGEVSQPLRTTMGVHLIKLDAKEPARPLPLQEVAGKIKEELYAKAMEERFQKWLKGDLRKRHRVDVKIPGIVFRPEEMKEATVESLIASSSRRSSNERSSFWSYLNPFSYIFTETPVEGDESGRRIVSLFGVPLFTTESAEDVPRDPLAPIDEKGSSNEESGGFFSVLKALNPFSRDR